MNKRELYECIMRNVAKEVKKALNENSLELTGVVIYDNYDIDYDSDYELELNERPEEETQELFYNYVRRRYFDSLCDYLDLDCYDTIDDDITDDDINNYFIDNEGIKEYYFEKFKEEDKINFIDRCEEINWSNLIKECDKIYGDFVLFGTKLRWTGTSNGLDIEEDCTLTNVIMLHSKDCELFKITLLDNGGILVKCSHHDGTNEFEIHLLNDYGCSVVENLEDTESDEEEQNYIKELKTSKCWENIEIDF